MLTKRYKSQAKTPSLEARCIRAECAAIFQPPALRRDGRAPPRYRFRVRILIDVVHPAQAHFFRPIVERLGKRGHEVLVTSRQKDCTIDLLDSFAIAHTPLTTAARTKLGLVKEMLVRDARLARVARKFRPDLVVGKEAACAHQVAWLLGIPSLAFDDTDDARWQRRLSLPFATRRAADPRAGVPSSTAVPGVSAVGYLHPNRVSSSVYHGSVLVRLVGWTASHDAGATGIEIEKIAGLVKKLSAFGRVFVSSERRLPADLQPHRLKIPAAHFHSWLAGCRLQVGESATLAAESAILGVPSVYCGSRRLWYTDLLEAKGLVTCVRSAGESAAAARKWTELPREIYLARRDAYLEEVGDPVDRWVETIEKAGFSGLS